MVDCIILSGFAGKDSCVELPIQFTAKDPGHYPCQIELCAPDDVRVYKVECTVNPEGSTAELEFKAPVHQSVTQEIPIVSFSGNFALKCPLWCFETLIKMNYDLIYQI